MSMSRTLFSLAGFQVITIGRFWVIAEENFPRWKSSMPIHVGILREKCHTFISSSHLTESNQSRHWECTSFPAKSAAKQENFERK
jgi:hypothetical protein